MIELKKYNYFTGEKNDVSHGVSDIVKFMDLAGSNYLLITPRKNEIAIGSGCLYHFLSNKIVYHDVSCFEEIISNKSNLFRIDLLVIDLWPISDEQHHLYLKCLSDLDIPILITASRYQCKIHDNVMEYNIRKEYKGGSKSEIWISDKNRNWTTTINSLKKSYIRDKKIEGLFGEE